MNKLILRSFIIFFLSLVGSSISEVKAQDPQYTQFYAAPLILNPALTGATGSTRFGLNYRNQWPQLNANFVNTSVFVDHFFSTVSSGVGLVIIRDQENLANLESLGAGLSYSYLFKTTENFHVRMGVSGQYINRRFNFQNLVFEDQLDKVSGAIVSATTAETFNGQHANYFDLNAGFVAYTKKLYLGFSASHITQPDRSFLSDDTSPLPMKLSVHMGYQIDLPGVKYTDTQQPRRKQRSITPAVHYKTQGDFSQLDIGAYVTLEPIVFGVSYRGLPVSSVENIANNESIIFLAGFSMPNFNFAYSFDYTISGLGISAGGAHELSIGYTIKRYRRRKPPKDVQLIPCPKF